MKRIRSAVGRVAKARRTAVEASGVLAIAAAGFTVHEGWAFLVIGGYLVLAANTTSKGGRR